MTSLPKVYFTDVHNYRAVRKFSGKDNLIAKLVSCGLCSFPTAFVLTYLSQFAKHMKVEEQVALLQNKKIGIGVGTPARLMELIDNGECLPIIFIAPNNYSKKKNTMFKV